LAPRLEEEGEAIDEEEGAICPVEVDRVSWRVCDLVAELEEMVLNRLDLFSLPERNSEFVSLDARLEEPPELSILSFKCLSFG